MTLIYAGRHECGYAFLVDSTLGAVLRCDECGRYWRRGRTLYTDGFHLEWKRVRPWNRRALARIRRATETETTEGATMDWEVEIKVRRKGRLIRRESALGDTPLFAFESATNDLVRELESGIDHLTT